VNPQPSSPRVSPQTHAAAEHPGGAEKFSRLLLKIHSGSDMAACGYYSSTLFKNQQKYFNEKLLIIFAWSYCFLR